MKHNPKHSLEQRIKERIEIVARYIGKTYTGRNPRSNSRRYQEIVSLLNSLVEDIQADREEVKAGYVLPSLLPPPESPPPKPTISDSVKRRIAKLYRQGYRINVIAAATKLKPGEVLTVVKKGRFYRQ